MLLNINDVMWVATESNPTTQDRSRRPGDPTMRRRRKNPQRSLETDPNPALELQSLPQRRGIARDPISFDEGESRLNYDDMDLPADGTARLPPLRQASSSQGWQYTTPLPPIPPVIRNHPYARYNQAGSLSNSTRAKMIVREDTMDLRAAAYWSETRVADSKAVSSGV